MPVSSFYGMQTSLRGLLAHQRMLDTTGHNIANASTKGYSRQEATLQASPAQHLTISNGMNVTGAQLGSGVDVTGFRRIREFHRPLPAAVVGDHAPGSRRRALSR